VEALFLSKINPAKPAKDLSVDEVKKLVDKIKQVIKAGIEHGGTTFDGKFVDISGLSGKHQKYLYVYGREDENCEICGGKITKIKIGGRGTYYCEKCQQ